MKFYDREDELSALQKIWESVKSGKFNLIIISGRRGVGKTRLIKEFVKRYNVRLAYIFVKKKQPELQIDRIIKRLESAIGLKLPRVKTIGDLFTSLMRIALDVPLCIVFDEFQNFSAYNHEIFTDFQNAFDELKMREKQVKILVIIIGSIIGMLREIFEKQESPLYGRKTAEIFLKPFRYWKIREMLFDLGVRDEKESFMIYSILGGMPRYYDTIDRLGFEFTIDNVLEYITSPTISAWKTVYGELIEEFKGAYMTYFQILEAIANGKNSIEEIANYTGMIISSIPKYLKELSEYFDIIIRRYPITEGPRSKKGRYFIKDPFYSFWFRFIYPNIDYLELGEPNPVKKIIKEELHHYASRIFEDVIRETIFVAAGVKLGNIKIPEMNKIGAWWDRRGNEIDIVGLKGKKIVLVGEIKFTLKPIEARDVINFLKKLDLIKSEGSTYIYISWSGFTNPARSVLEESKVIPIELKDLVLIWEKLA